MLPKILFFLNSMLIPYRDIMFTLCVIIIGWFLCVGLLLKLGKNLLQFCNRQKGRSVEYEITNVAILSSYDADYVFLSNLARLL